MQVRRGLRASRERGGAGVGYGALSHVVLLFEAIEQSSTEMYYLGRGRNPLKVFLYFKRNNGNL